MTEVEGVTRLTRLLPLACLVAAVCLFASELMTTFEFTPPGGEPLDSQDGADRHGNALALIAVFAVASLAIAVFAASKPAATAVAVAGVVALLVFLIVDLPDANAVGTLDDTRQAFFDAEAVPQEGFFMALVSSLALAITGIALATLSPEQLAALRPPRSRRPSKPGGRESAQKPVEAGATAHNQADDENTLRRLTRRPRARQRG